MYIQFTSFPNNSSFSSVEILQLFPVFFRPIKKEEIVEIPNNSEKGVIIDVANDVFRLKDSSRMWSGWFSCRDLLVNCIKSNFETLNTSTRDFIMQVSTTHPVYAHMKKPITVLQTLRSNTKALKKYGISISKIPTERYATKMNGFPSGNLHYYHVNIAQEWFESEPALYYAFTLLRLAGYIKIQPSSKAMYEELKATYPKSIRLDRPGAYEMYFKNQDLEYLSVIEGYPSFAVILDNIRTLTKGVTGLGYAGFLQTLYKNIRYSGDTSYPHVVKQLLADLRKYYTFLYTFMNNIIQSGLSPEKIYVYPFTDPIITKYTKNQAQAYVLIMEELTKNSGYEFNFEITGVTKHL